MQKVFLEILQNSQESTRARVSFLIKLLKKRLWHRCFLVNFTKCLRTNFLAKDLRWLLLLLLIYLFDYYSSKSTFFTLIWHLTFSRVKFLSNKLEFFVSYSSFPLLAI